MSSSVKKAFLRRVEELFDSIESQAEFEELRELRGLLICECRECGDKFIRDHPLQEFCNLLEGNRHKQREFKARRRALLESQKS